MQVISKGQLNDRFVLISVLSAFLAASIICAAVLANQVGQPGLIAFGRSLHLASVIASSFLLCILYGKAILLFVAITAACFVFGWMSYSRLPYLLFLNVMFFATGATINWNRRDLAVNVLATITIASGLMMLLQLLGVGEWTQFLTTHGITGSETDGSVNQISKQQHPTFMVDESRANFLQGRPAGLLYSNQFASLIILVAIALRLGQEKHNPLVDFLLSLTAVLSMSKIVFLGMTVMIAVGLTVKGEHRRTAAGFLLFTIACISLYAIFFPGMFQSMLNPQIILASTVLRIADILIVIMGGDHAPTVATLAQPLGSLDYRLAERVTAGLFRDGRTHSSAFASLAAHKVSLIAAAALLSMALCASEIFRQRSFAVLMAIRAQHVLVLAALMVFSFSADFSDSLVFWFCAGFSIVDFRRLSPE